SQPGEHARCQLERAAKYWDQATRQNWKSGIGLYWTDLEPVRRRLRLKAAGDPEVEWDQYVVNTYLSGRIPLTRVLSLGCGEGILERRLAGMAVFAECDAFDISTAALQRAREAAESLGLHSIYYQLADLNTITLPDQAYDAAFAESSLHHVHNLEHLLQQVSKSLVPGGWLFAKEYVGPSRFQFSDAQLNAMNAALHLLPEKYRVSLRSANRGLASPPELAGTLFLRLLARLRSGGILSAVGRRVRRLLRRSTGRPILKERIRRPDIAQLKISDPSEAVRSAEIIPLLGRYFEVVEVRPLGGSLLHFLLDDIAGNFDPNLRQDSALLEMLFAVEDALIDAGVLGHDFAVLICRKPL
ncbi:MAG: class I SAM-dependent methyltransferase, partial [Armatimonadota bacterium]